MSTEIVRLLERILELWNAGDGFASFHDTRVSKP